MHTSAHDLVASFREHADPRVRRNCSVALAALAGAGDSRGLSELLTVAVTDVDPSVRAHAEQQIINLPVNQQQQIGAALIARIEVPGADAVKARETLGRLRVMGLPIGQTGKSFKARIWQAGAMRGHQWRQRWSSVLLGGLVGWGMLSLLLALTLNPNPEAYFELFWTSMGAALVFAPHAVLRRRSLLLEWDEPAVMVRDALESSLIAGALAWVVAFIVLTGADIQIRHAARFSGLIAVAFGLSAAAVQGSCALAVRALVIRTLRRPLEYLTGLAGGVIVLSAARALARWRMVNNDQMADEHMRIIAGTLIVAIPALAAMAWVISKIDVVEMDVPPVFFSRSRRLAAIGVVLACVGVTGAPLALAAILAAFPRPIISDNPLSGKSQEIELRILRSGTVPLDVRFPQRISVLATGGRIPPRIDLPKAKQADGASCSSFDVEGVVSKDADRARFREALLSPGCYVARVEWTPTPAGGLSDLLDELGADDRRALVTVNADRAMTVKSGSSNTIEAGALSSMSDQSPVTISMSLARSAYVVTFAASDVTPFALPPASDAPKITILKGSGLWTSWPGATEGVLGPGTYTVSADFTNAARGSLYIRSRKCLNSDVKSLPIKDLPSESCITIDRHSQILLTVEDNQGSDLVLELLNGTGTRVIAKGDDPDRIFTGVEAGVYILRVRAYNETRFSLRSPATLRVSVTPQ